MPPAMLQPTPEQLAALPASGRIAFRVADLLSKLRRRHINDAFMSAMIGSCGSRRLAVRGMEHLAGLGPESSVLFVSNHRSFFDFYLLNAALVWNHSPLPRRLVFPVRASFFYDHPLGPFVNLAMSGMRMFPPIFRERTRAPFNKFALARCVEELAVPGTVMGLHPEGTRNKGPDPYAFLPAQPGVGKIALEAKHAHVIPVFVLGMSSSLPREFVRNWSAGAREEHRIDLWFGPEIDLSDLRASGSRPATQKRAADRCLAAIGKLAEEHRALTADGARGNARGEVPHAPGEGRSVDGEAR